MALLYDTESTVPPCSMSGQLYDDMLLPKAIIKALNSDAAPEQFIAWSSLFCSRLEHTASSGLHCLLMNDVQWEECTSDDTRPARSDTPQRSGLRSTTTLVLPSWHASIHLPSTSSCSLPASSAQAAGQVAVQFGTRSHRKDTQRVTRRVTRTLVCI